MDKQKRHIGLSILIVLLILSNSFGAYKLAIDSEKFIAVYPSFSVTQIKALVIIPIVTIISLVAMWFGKSWTIVITIIMFAIVIFLDVYFNVWYHALLASVSFILLMYFCWKSKNHFLRHQT